MSKKRKKRRQRRPTQAKPRRQTSARELRETKKLAVIFTKITVLYFVCLVGYVLMKMQHQRFIHLPLQLVLLGGIILGFSVILWATWFRGRPK